MKNMEFINAISAKIAAAISEATGTHIPAATYNDTDTTAQYRFGLHYHDAMRSLPAEQAQELGRVLSSLDMYINEISAGHDNFADQVLNSIPAEFLPDGPNGPRTSDAREQAETDLEVLSRARNARSFQRADTRYPGLIDRYLPDGFTPESEGEAADAERALAAWEAMRSSRDELVRRALAAGVTKMRVHQITGISRATIDRIPGV